MPDDSGQKIDTTFGLVRFPIGDLKLNIFVFTSYVHAAIDRT